MTQQPNLNDDAVAPAFDGIVGSPELEQLIVNTINQQFNDTVKPALEEKVTYTTLAVKTDTMKQRIDGLETCIDLFQGRLRTVETNGNAELARRLCETEEKLDVLLEQDKVNKAYAVIALSYVVYREELLRPSVLVGVLAAMVAAYFSMKKWGLPK